MNNYKKLKEPKIKNKSNEECLSEPNPNHLESDTLIEKNSYNETLSKKESSNEDKYSESSGEPLSSESHVEVEVQPDNNFTSNLYDITAKIRRNVLLSKSLNYEGLDYDTNENEIHQAEKETKNPRSIEIQRWVVCLLIGISTGLTAVIINLSIIQLSHFKEQLIKKLISNCTENQCLYQPMLTWIGFNIGFVLIAVLLTVFLSPVAAGSGIPQIKCFLNGVKVPNVVRFSTYLTKVIGVIFTVCGGLASGKEGPMIHAGAVLAAGISQGRSLTFGIVTKFFKHFRNDREKRDFVCAGAAAGVSAAFGAPVGGVLFSLEEASSFWNQALTWRIFFCSVLSGYTLNLLMSIYNGHSGDLAHSGLLNFGKFDGSYEGFELPIFFAMGLLGGLFGAAFNSINYRLTVHRMKYLKSKWLKIFEVMQVSASCAAVSFFMIYINRECNPLGQDPFDNLQMYCYDGQYNVMSALIFKTPEHGMKSIFHDPPGSILPSTIFMFVIPYFFLACWTYGLQVPSGVFIPSILIGASWGRLVGIAVNMIFPQNEWTQDLSKYALMGAAAQLGGTVRMTISLTVILMEATGSITYGFPLMGVLLIAKWVGDYFNEGIYNLHIELLKIPILDWDCKPECSFIKIKHVMSTPVITLTKVSKMSIICEILSTSKCHSAYPIIDEKGKFRGLIRLYEIVVLMRKKMYIESISKEQRLNLNDFLQTYPRYNTLLKDLNISQEELDYHIDLEPYISPCPYVVYEDSSLSKVFSLFRSLGLRHLVVLDDNHKVVGMITRKDLWLYGESHTDH